MEEIVRYKTSAETEENILLVHIVVVTIFELSPSAEATEFIEQNLRESIYFGNGKSELK